jgi:hypothetical protein
MRFLQRPNDPQQNHAGADNDSDSGERLQQIRAQSDSLLAAGDDAIQRALAGSNSEAFLRSTRQLGGQ